MPLTPEQQARETIDEALQAAGWAVQFNTQVNLGAGRGVAVCEAALAKGHGHADYLLYVDGKAAGIIEAKKPGIPLTGVEVQAEKYAKGLPAALPAHHRPLPFLYQSTGVETRFSNLLDPAPRSRRVFTFHRPETLAEWLEAEPLWLSLKNCKPQPESERPATLRRRHRHLPDLDEFVDLFKPGSLNQRKATWTEKKPDGRWRSYGIDEVLARDKASLDIFWLKDESLEDSANLPPPEVIAAEIAEDLRAALEQFEAIQADLSGQR